MKDEYDFTNAERGKFYIGNKPVEVSICNTNSEKSEDITETSWYQKMQEETTPGSTLKQYRQRSEMSQTELAQKLGMVKQNISAMENGTRDISKATAHKLAEIFQVSPGRFIK